MTIRKEKESDIDPITELHNRAFNGPNEGRIVENLRSNKNLTLSLVCEVDDQLAGHIAYSPIKNDNEETIGIGLAPVGVLPSRQNQGVGSQLIEHGNQAALDLGFSKVFVLGDPEYYGRFGFVLANEYKYYCKFDPEGRHFMVFRAQEREPQKTIVNYGNEFDG